MYCADYAERPQLNDLSFMLHELVCPGYHSLFALYPCSFALYTYGCEIYNHRLQLRYGCILMRLFSLVDAGQMETIIKIILINK